MEEFEFERDNVNLIKGNTYKLIITNAERGLTPEEMESVFKDLHIFTEEDFVTNRGETEYICIGKSSTDKILFQGFVLRNNKIRIFTSRIASKKEKNIYYEQIS